MRNRLWFPALAICFFVAAIKSLPDIDSKKPQDEEVILKRERKLQSGQVVYVQILRCKRCGQVISYVESDKTGKPTGGYLRTTHRCGRRWGIQDDYDGLAIGPRHFDFLRWLDSWQKRLAQ